MNSRLATSPVAAIILVFVLVGCDGSGPALPTRSAGQADGGVPVGRTVCPGSVKQALRIDDDATADLVEGLQTRYEGDLGFLAVVWDGRNAVIVVEAARLLAWEARMASRGITVAPSCINPALLAAIQAALPQVAARAGGGIMAGYNGVDDAITVMGVEPDDLLAALDEVGPDARDAAVATIADGTLRIDPRSAGDSDSGLA
jgi:hypothetical protein